MDEILFDADVPRQHMRQNAIREGGLAVELSHHFELVDGHDRAHGDSRRRGHAPGVARKAALAEEVPGIEHGDHGFSSRVRQDRQPYGACLQIHDGGGRIALTRVPVEPSILTTRGSMPDETPQSEVNRENAEERREDAEDLRQRADQDRDGAEGHRVLAEAARKEAEQFRVLAEEARALAERYREELESVRQERESLRHAAEEARRAAEESRHATIAAVAATADALSANLKQMQFLEDARNTLRQLKAKSGDVQ